MTEKLSNQKAYKFQLFTNGKINSLSVNCWHNYRRCEVGLW